MSDNERPIDWDKTTFDGSRREQLRQARAMTVRQRLEALDQLTELSERMQTMPKRAKASDASANVHEPHISYSAGRKVHEIVLNGCTPTPLANYLKALAVLRLLSAKYPETRGFWRGGRFVLRTTLDREGIERFFLDVYEPTPIISPWSGRAGFLEGDDNKQSKRKGAVIIDKVEHSSGARFYAYRTVLASIKNVSVITRLDKTRAELKRLEKLKKSKGIDKIGLERLSVLKSEEKGLKGSLLQSLRGELDDTFLPWLDACFALTMDERMPAPLLGSGGNEGSMDFSINHVGYLLELIDLNTDKPTSLAENLLPSCLFGATCPLDSRSNIGFLNTLATGGVNMSIGFDGHSSGNTWDGVLAMEGALLFASSTTKKLESTRSGRPSFPFAVSPSYAGAGSIASRESARPELWLPIWNVPVSIMELSALLAEGRVTLGKHQPENGLDMLRALASLGVNRGIAAFERYGFYERRGQGYYVATHLGTHSVPNSAVDNWFVRDLGYRGWLGQFRRFAQGKNTANRFAVLCKRLEDSLFSLSGREPSKPEAQALLTLLGEIHVALSSSRKAIESVRPVPRLSERWVMAGDDGTPAFRIAKALAGLRGMGDEPLPLRAQLFPVQRRFDQWIKPEALEKARIYTGRNARLTETLRALLERRLWLAGKFEIGDKPLASPAGAALDDVAAFLRDDSMDACIAALLPGLSLCSIPEDLDKTAGGETLPAAFGLLKLALTPDRILRSLGWLGEQDHLPIPAGMLTQLAAGNQTNRGVKIAWRRLRSSGLAPVFSIDALPELTGIEAHRAAAALLIPLRFGATGELARRMLKMPEPKSEVA